MAQEPAAFAVNNRRVYIPASFPRDYKVSGFRLQVAGCRFVGFQLSVCMLHVSCLRFFRIFKVSRVFRFFFRFSGFFQVAGCRFQILCCMLKVVGCRLLVSGCKVSSFRLQVAGSRFQAGFRLQLSGFSSGFRLPAFPRLSVSQV